MNLSTALIALAMSAVATAYYTVSYDTVYDEGYASVSTVACSSVLESQGYTTFSTLPGFPFIGGSPQITGYGSPYCGSCWVISYTDPSTGTTIAKSITTIDVGDPALEGFNLSLEAMNYLTGGRAEQLGRIDVQAWPC